MKYSKRKLDQIRIEGYEVSIATHAPSDYLIVNAYVTIPNSRHLKTEFLGSEVTYRDGDEIGVDTNKRYMQKPEPWSEARMVIEALNQIKGIINRCKATLVLKD